jgi:hypothetical protein
MLIQTYIKAAINETLRKRQMSPEQVIAEVEGIAQASIKDLGDARSNA